MHRSINWKIGRLVLVAVGVALMIGSGIGLWREVERYGAQKRNEMIATSHVFGAAAAQAIENRDRRAVLQAIRAIGRVPGLTYAAVHDADGALLAELGDGVRLDGDLDIGEGIAFSPFALAASSSVLVRSGVVSGGRSVGAITLIGDTSDLRDRLRELILVALATAALAAGIGLAISIQMQRQITRPLVALAQTMTSVRLSHNYEARAPVTSNDEIGQLALSFNAMIGEIRKRDDRLARYRESLEDDVAARTRDLLEAKEVAEEASRAKSDFLATMSHEIRTPMNGVLVMAELLAGSDLPERQRRYAEVIARSGQSLLSIINDILDFAKVESGKLELEATRVDLRDVADTVTALFGEKARAAGLDLAAVVEPGAPRFVSGDPTRLTQVLSNLVGNAVKFTKEGRVTVRIGRDDADPARLRVSVEDTGVGIPADKVDAIFNAFSQADQTTTRRFGGTGLGLSICKRLVEAMGGEIGVDSEPGVGSRFWFVAPLPEIVPAGGSGAPSAAADGAAPLFFCARGLATRQAVSALAHEAGVLMREPAAEPALLADPPPAIWLADADDLIAVGARPARATGVVALAPFGDPVGEEALARGLADALLRRPVSTQEAMVLLERVGRGEPLAEPRDEAARPGGDLARFGSARVLVADDSPVNREVAVAALARFGVVPDTAADGREALAAARAGYDLILMDVSMPEMDGYEASRRIRALEQAGDRPRAAIVALTAHVVGADAEGWRNAGMDAILHKPFTIEKLGATLARFLAADAASDATSPAPASVRDAAPSQAAAPDASGLDADPLDRDAVAQLAEMAQASGPDFIVRVVGLYAEHAPRAFADLVAAARGGDAGASAAAAHALKSMSVNIGAAALAARLEAIERAARDAGATPDEQVLEDVGGVLDASLAALAQAFPEASRDLGEAQRRQPRSAA